MRRDDVEPAPWTAEGIERSKKLGLTLQFPEGYLEAMANKEKKVKKPPTKSEPSSPASSSNQSSRSQSKPSTPEHSHGTRSNAKYSGTQSNGNQKRPIEDDEKNEDTLPSKSVKLSEEEKEEEEEEVEEKEEEEKKGGETFQLTEQQDWLIKEDSQNQKLWDQVLSSIKEGPKFLKNVEQTFMCVCCQELVYQPVTTACLHNVCKSCLQRSFRAEVYSCPACRFDLGKTYTMVPNKVLQTLLDQFFPGYSKGR